GVGRATSSRAVTTASTRPGAVWVTSQSATTPRPSPTRMCSPGRTRSAWPACRPSEPSSATGPPTSGTSAARKSGGVTGPRGGARGSRRSVSRDRVAQAGEQATPTGGVLADHLALVAVGCAHLLHELAALAVQPLGDHEIGRAHV